MSDRDSVTMIDSKHRGVGGKGTYPTPKSHIRIARPSKSLGAAENSYVDGLGLEVRFRKHSSQHPGDGGHDLLMVWWRA
ncbi:hypothetical protein N7451_012367 [Penicillium sp. IBT 35674x]|nr:hypothetical protein N7451_012367 [Penicillium sp. IBT 35674x]